MYVCMYLWMYKHLNDLCLYVCIYSHFQLYRGDQSSVLISLHDAWNNVWWVLLTSLCIRIGWVHLCHFFLWSRCRSRLHLNDISRYILAWTHTYIHTYRQTSVYTYTQLLKDVYTLYSYMHESTHACIFTKLHANTSIHINKCTLIQELECTNAARLHYKNLTIVANPSMHAITRCMAFQHLKIVNNTLIAPVRYKIGYIVLYHLLSIILLSFIEKWKYSSVIKHYEDWVLLCMRHWWNSQFSSIHLMLHNCSAVLISTAPLCSTFLPRSTSNWY